MLNASRFSFNAFELAKLKILVTKSKMSSEK